MKRILSALTMLALSSCGAAPAFAQANCGSAVEFASVLEKNGQQQVGGGIVSKDAVLVIYATPDGERWTALTMGTDGSACFVMRGDGWFGGLPELPGPGERGA